MMNVTATLTPEDEARVAAINAVVPGWSSPAHYLFFKAMLELPLKRMLILGVYHGRDIAFLVDILKRYHEGREIQITGVDRFTADPCADWTHVNKVLTWEEEVHAPPPSFTAAVENTADPRVEIVKSDDFAFLDTTDQRFDFVYQDTAHDFATVTRQHRQLPRVCTPDAIICGDDFSDRHTWGVESAVKHSFGDKFALFANWIWYTNRKELKV